MANPDQKDLSGQIDATKQAAAVGRTLSNENGEIDISRHGLPVDEFERKEIRGE